MALINPYNQVNSPNQTLKLQPLVYTDAFIGANISATAPYAWLNEGYIYLASSKNVNAAGYSFKYEDVYGYIKTAYAAGTLGQWTVNFTGVSVVTGAQYTITINSGNGALAGSGLGVGTNVTFSSQLGTTTDLANNFYAALSGLISGGYVTATNNNAGTITVTEATTTTDGLSFYPSDANIVITNTVADVQPSGTPAQVANYVAGITTGTYDTYLWVLKHDVDQSNSVLGHQYEYIIVFGDTTGANYSNFSNTMGQFDNTADWLPSTWSQNLMKKWFGFQS